MPVLDSLLNISYLPGIGAAFLSLYNWFQLRRGARLSPNKFVTYGFFTATIQNHFYLPILINNDGKSSGLVSEITIYFQNSQEKNAMKIKRRVELRMDEDRTNRSPNPDPRDYKDLVPLLPVHIPANSGEFLILECIDKNDENAIIKLDQPLSCTIEIVYGKTKANVTFPFELKSKEVSTTGGIAWLNP